MLPIYHIFSSMPQLLNLFAFLAAEQQGTRVLKTRASWISTKIIIPLATGLKAGRRHRARFCWDQKPRFMERTCHTSRVLISRDLWIFMSSPTLWYQAVVTVPIWRENNSSASFSPVTTIWFLDWTLNWEHWWWQIEIGAKILGLDISGSRD